MTSKNLSVLHINQSDRLGGAGRSAYRIHESLRDLGLSSRMLVADKRTGDNDVRLISPPTLKLLDRASYHVFERLSLQYLFYPSSFLLIYDKWFKEADIIQLFNTHNNYFSHVALPLISRHRPVVWRLSDMWSMTGHCTHALGCERWKSGCGSCPILSDYPALRWDATALLWKIKKMVYSRSLITIVAPSKWIGNLARESPLLGRFPIHHIPNGVDTSIFFPINKQHARELVGIDSAKTVLLFTSHMITTPLKGAGFLEEALNRLAENTNPDRVLLLVVGRGARDWYLESPFETKRVEHVFNDEMMAAIYSAADIFMLASLADTFPNVVLESMACGTPPITFDVGGCPELVRHMETGYLAAYKDTTDFANGIKLLISNSELRERLSQNGLEVVSKEYYRALEAQRFKSLYEDIMRWANEAET